ncbi:hypothetical protein HBI12_032310 [Parastagonospora nodorum]|nr:hypothetical protein HBI12_032310 [Parastagonospora nodorum]
MDLNFVPSVAFISDVYIADSLRARILINLSAVLNIDLNFVPSVAFISNVHIANSLRARTLINLSAVLYEQAAARTSLSAKVSNISLSAKVSIIDLNFVPSVAFNAIGNVELTGDLLDNADRVNNNNNNERTASLAKRIKTDENRKKSTHPGNNRNNLNIMVTDPTGREFGRVDMKSLTRLCLLIDRAKANRLIWILYCKQKWAYNISKFYKRLTPGELGSIYVLRIVSKSDKVPTRELSSYIKTELYPHQKQALYFMWDKEQDYSAEEHDYCKFYHLVITSEDTHCKQIIKKVYIMSLERASLILFIT